ncbi:hypothetical protein WDW89_12715 [Deltaproteobacteria bacterium TL4]
MPRKTIDLIQAQDQFPQLITMALGGQQVILTEEGRPVLSLNVILEELDDSVPLETITQETGSKAMNLVELLEEFLAEVLSELITIDIELNLLANAPHDRKQLKKVFGIFHKIKYNSNIISAKKLRQVAESTELLIEQLQFHQQTLDDFPIELLQESADMFVAIVRNMLRDKCEGNVDIVPLVMRIQGKVKEIKER